MSESNNCTYGFIRTFFMVIGIITSIIMVLIMIAIIAVIYIKPFGVDITEVVPAILEEPVPSEYDHPYLTTKQEQILESAGVEVKNIPTEITQDQEQCAIEAIGLQRVNDIKAGSAPTITDVLKTKHCLE
jgi:hypothetical protein